MIGKLKGKIDSVDETSLIIDVGGVGYKVHCSSKTLAKFDNGQMVDLYIETHVREDLIQLFGFNSKTEQITFNTLQTVKGVGTRMALAILSQLSPEQIQLALGSQDKNAFNNVSGVGKKLAERIITELKDNIFSHVSSFKISSGDSDMSQISQSNIINDAVAALTQLGINRSDAYTRVTNIMAKSPNFDINDVIRLALQNQI